MTTANKITDIDLVARAKSLLLEQFKDKENINKVVEALLEQVQELDTTANELQQVRMLDNAYGIYLDNIGEKLKVQRTTLDDNDYRTAIKVRMIKNRSKGSITDVDRIIGLLTYDLFRTIYTTHPYVVEICCYIGCLNTQEGLELLRDLFPVNIAVRIQNSTSTPFGFAGNPNAVGFGDATTIGGQLCSLISSNYGNTQSSKFKQVKQVIVPTEDPANPSGELSQYSVPLVSTPPTISPTDGLYEGDILTATTGLWMSFSAVSYSYQWYRGASAINSATDVTYTLSSLDVGNTIYCKVIATNDNGNGEASSNAVTVLSSAPVSSGVLLNAGLNSTYSAQTSTGYSCELTIRFNTDGTLTIFGTNIGSNTQPFLSVTGAGESNGYEVQYYTETGDPFNTVPQGAWLPLSTTQSFLMSVNKETRDKGGKQTFTIRRISDQVITQATTYISVSCDIEI